MAGLQDSPEVIATTLHHIEVLHEQGRCLTEVVREIGITEPTYRRWRQQYGGLSSDQIRWMRQLIHESRWLGATRH